MITTAVFNGIEFRIQPNGAVEIFADRPSVVQITDLQELLTSFLKAQTSTEVQSYGHSQQLSYKLHEEPCRRPLSSLTVLIVLRTSECKRRDKGLVRFSRVLLMYLKKHDKIQ